MAGAAWLSAQQTPLTQQPPLPPLVVPMPDVLKNYPPVTASRLTAPADGDWLMVRRTYDGWGYSPLDQITAANVRGLRPAWVFSTGVNSGHEAAPIVHGGVMFVSTPEHKVVAIDAKTGVLLWRYTKQVPEALWRRIPPRAASRSTATRSTSPPTTRCWWRSMPAPARKCGRRRWPRTRTATT